MAQPSFADIAVALELHALDLGWRASDMELVAARIGLSPVGVALLLSQRRLQTELVVIAFEFFKAAIPVETEVRALVERSVAA